MAAIRLSFCITTRNRAKVIGTTLENLLEQCSSEVEVVVVDGASTDDSVAVITEIASRHPQLRLITPKENSGLDADFDKAVQAARGTYCWLFSDDDLIVPGAVARVLQACAEDPWVVITNVSVHNADFTEVELERRLPAEGRERYGPDDCIEFFRDCADHLTFIGAVVVKRDFWLSRERKSYYGTEFIHCGVLFQAPIPGTMIVLREPLVKIRHGVGNWLTRWVDVWMYKWPKIVWSFTWIDESIRREVHEAEPWTNWQTLFWARMRGYYDFGQFRKVVAPRATRVSQLWKPLTLAVLPKWLLVHFRQGAAMDRLRAWFVDRMGNWTGR
ncbi:MAG TPA: glycosyltransferase family 2 protein [Polyangiaceae bacterium]